jgi:alkaline phosphatase
MKRIITVAFIALLAASAPLFIVKAGGQEKPVNTGTAGKKPKNIIFLIGDGMGLSQISAAVLTTATPLSFERFKHVGFSKTYSGDKLITDSAAGATAFSCGVKTYNGAVGVNMDTIPQETIMETAKKNGLSIGFIVTCTVTHATPACFYAHLSTRKDDQGIAADLLNSGVDVFAGGGQPFFTKRKDGRNLVKEMEAKGYTITSNLSELIKAKSEKLGMLYPDTNLPSMLNGRGDYLPKAVMPVVDHLSQNKKGFFLMIEGSQIDWGGHANNSDYIITETRDFAQAVGNALDFAEKDGNTLVVVTADHETGGYALNAEEKDPKKLKGTFNTNYHTATMVPVFAYGPGAEEFDGIFENTAIYHKMMELLGLKK